MTGPIFQIEKLSQSNPATPQGFFLNRVGAGPETAAGACPVSQLVHPLVQTALLPQVMPF